MFRGVQHISIDAKGRLAIPAKQRERLLEICGGELVATIDLRSRCLLIYPVQTWDEKAKQIQQLPNMSEDVRRVQRLLLGYASDLEMDKAGRVLLPPALREHAQLEKKSVLAGQGDKFELWSEPLWIEECKKGLEQTMVGESLPELADFVL